MDSSWETYKGKKFFYARYGNKQIDTYRNEVEAVEKEMFAQPKNSVLLLVETAGVILTPEAINLAKNTALHCKPYLLKTAILGMGGLRKGLLDVVAKFSGMTLEGFDTEQQAKDWLVQ